MTVIKVEADRTLHARFNKRELPVFPARTSHLAIATPSAKQRRELQQRGHLVER